jgi:tRNA dimethylallyltransferase
MRDILASAAPDRPILLAGPTASGKSALALHLAEAQGRTVVNADALQVFSGWRILTARPGRADLARAPHELYGHVPLDGVYSAGHWLRDIAPLLRQRPAPVIVGGTGLYFLALTAGLADIPATDPAVRHEAGQVLRHRGLEALVADLDPATRLRVDLRNPMRVQRAWEVQRQTGQSMAAWHDRTAPPLLPPEQAQCLLITAGKDWLAERIDRRFAGMIQEGTLDEARALRAGWSADTLSAQAIGASELMAVIDGRLSLAEAATAATLATRQYAKRQRTWFRRRMQAWTQLEAAEVAAFLASARQNQARVGTNPQRST